MALSKIQIQEIIKLKQEDLKNREGGKKGVTNQTIAEKVLGSRSAESSVRRIWRSFKKIGNYRGVGTEGVVAEVTPKEAYTLNTLPDSVLQEIISGDDKAFANLAKRLRTAQNTNTMLRKIHRGMVDPKGSAVQGETLLEGIERAAKSLATSTYKPTTSVSVKGQKATLEVLLSDLQTGKVSRHYNSKIAQKALKNYGEGILGLIKEREGKYQFERIVFALIGDLAEDHSKHGVSSAVSCDNGLSEQLHDAIEGIWKYVLKPMADLGIEMDVICVTGNHASSMHKGMDSFMAGRFSYDFVIHKTLESFCRISGMDHVTFNIPDGTFGHLEIYNKHVIYEHGYHNPCTEKGMTDQMRKRGSQLKIHPTYWRQGDRHHHACFGQGELILNAAFFGIEQEGIEYSGILGFDSIPNQTVCIHVDDTRLGHGNVKEVVNIQVTPDL